ncbi:MAG: 16S rRNA (cytosine(1402)-N(4))-methyltransferase RsmH [Candidatus Paceibacterota bacterium]|nr:MAG: 16S rRNA (cytosine(1402)-N(4))-methyltransferase RsmH [Candidatus Paceibacterota bacterium]
MHVPVLLKETIDCLGFTDKDKIFLDATVGAGGHSLEICKRFPWLQIIAIDADEEALSLAEENLKIGGCQFEVKIENFRNLAKTMDELGIQKVDKILFDIGMSSMHIDISGRGFSFQKDEPLLMTMKKELEGSLTAYEIVNSWPKDEIEKILRDYGEESFARKIAEQIVKERKKGPIKTTLDLVKVIEDATPKFYRHKRIHPATKTFQAIRIAVNDELESLKEGIGQAFERLRVGGRLAVISFHSLEDRIVKKNFKELEKNGKGKLITKKPLTASFEEIKINSRSRSAKLRVIEKI